MAGTNRELVGRHRDGDRACARWIAERRCVDIAGQGPLSNGRAAWAAPGGELVRRAAVRTPPATLRDLGERSPNLGCRPCDGNTSGQRSPRRCGRRDRARASTRLLASAVGSGAMAVSATRIAAFASPRDGARARSAKRAYSGSARSAG
jgi:hypothetical protein